MSALPAVHRLYGAEAYFYASRFGFRINHSRTGAKLEHRFHNFAQIYNMRARQLGANWWLSGGY